MLEDILAFQTIVQYGSFTRAGKALGISTPVMTRRLARLEESLNTRLIQRTTRQIHLTEADEIFLDKIRDVLCALEDSTEAVKMLANDVTGTLKIGLTVTMSNLVTKMLYKFTNQYPNINLHIVTGNNLLYLLSNGFDLVIHSGTVLTRNGYIIIHDDKLKKIGYEQLKITTSDKK